MKIDLQHLQQWVGKTEQQTDLITPAPVAALAATLDRDEPPPRNGDPLPPLWHWLYFLPVHRQSQLGPDGHPKRGGFLPPVPLPRRMWAGSQLSFKRALTIGSAIQRVSRILEVKHKSGRSGELVFVKVQHTISDAQGLAISEEHTLVYRDNPRPDAAPAVPQPAPADHAWSREIHPDPVLLFRYSALTFNGHRIHYDRPYATDTEGYPGLVVHGPLIATLLLDALRRNNPKANVASFSFRAVSPLFDINPFAVCGRPDAENKSIHLWARDADGYLTMDARACYSTP